MKAFNPVDRYACWIMHETFFADVEKCLHAYEASSFFSKDSVNWALFHSIVANTTLQRELLGQKERKKDPTRKKTHAPCAEIFPLGGEMEQLVRETDPWLFEKLGYRSCCSESDHTTNFFD